MRITSIILTVLGSLAAALLAVKWLGDASTYRETLEAARALGVDMSEIDGIVRAAYALLGTAAVGALAVGLLVKERGAVAAGLLALAVAVPAVLAPKSLVFTFLLVIAAGFALAVRRRAEPAMRRHSQLVAQ